jgi:hypothetical protein
MEIPEVLKKKPVLIGGAVVALVIIIALAKKGQGTTPSGGTDIAAINAANSQIAQLNADVAKAQIQAGRDITLGSYTRDVNLANLTTAKEIAAAKIISDEDVSLQSLDYSHDIANRQLENNRILGLTQEDTKRLISTQENQTRLSLGITAIDAQRFIAERSLNAQEVEQARELEFQQQQLDSQERIADFTSSRALTYQQIVGSNQVAAIKANKPGFWQSLGGILKGGAGLAELFV